MVVHILIAPIMLTITNLIGVRTHWHAARVSAILPPAKKTVQSPCTTFTNPTCKYSYKYRYKYSYKSRYKCRVPAQLLQTPLSAAKRRHHLLTIGWSVMQTLHRSGKVIYLKYIKFFYTIIRLNAGEDTIFHNIQFLTERQTTFIRLPHCGT